MGGFSFWFPFKSNQGSSPFVHELPLMLFPPEIPVPGVAKYQARSLARSDALSDALDASATRGLAENRSF